MVIVYLLRIGRALLVDKRRSGTDGPWVGLFPQQEWLLEGTAVQPPLTPQIVQLIERRRVMPADQRTMESYFEQLLRAIGYRLALLRPALPAPQRLALGPHFGASALLATSDLWQGLLRDLEERGEQEAVRQARVRMRELYGHEVLHAERLDLEELALLRQDPGARETYRRLTL